LVFFTGNFAKREREQLITIITIFFGICTYNFFVFKLKSQLYGFEEYFGYGFGKSEIIYET